MNSSSYPQGTTTNDGFVRLPRSVGKLSKKDSKESNS